MANLRERRDKNGKLIAFTIRVYRGRDRDGNQLKPYITRFEVSPSWKEDTARKKAETFAAVFEKECLEGTITDTRKTFADYCDYVIKQKEINGAKHTTIVTYQYLAKRINSEIGHIKLKDLRVDHLNTFYSKLRTERTKEGHAFALVDLAALLKEKGLSRVKLAGKAGLAQSTIDSAVKKGRCSEATARAMAKALRRDVTKLFRIETDEHTASPKTVLEHHRLISAVLSQALKEGLVPFNVAERATLPKHERKEINYFHPEEIGAIRDALEEEPILWKTLTHMLLITGARRGEILGLKWDAVDLVHNRIHICNNVLYTTQRGIYEDTPKTKKSDRYVSLPSETVDLLKWYGKWQEGEKERFGEYYVDRGFVFAQDNGDPVRPDTVTRWLSKFSERHGLKHINPHAFRHTMASLLYFNGVDAVSISSRLGHAQVSTTTDIYAHVMQEADERNADILSRVLLQKKSG